MQPLSRVDTKAVTTWGEGGAMKARPTLAAKVAQCIALWADLEVYLGAFLATILHTNERAALAIYMGLENRAAQLRLITSAAEATLSPQQMDAITILFSAVVRPAMRQRDKLAHWNWGHSEELPDALLLAPPKFTLDALVRTSRSGLRSPDGSPSAAAGFDEILVVRDDDLSRLIRQFADVKAGLELAMPVVWSKNSDTVRAEWLQKLSNVPQIREGLDRLNADRQKTQATQKQSRQPTSGD